MIERLKEQQHLLNLQNEQLGEAHADLELARHRFADLYESAPAGYVTLDGRGCIREINRSAAELLGLSPAHLTSKPFVPYVAAADRKVFLKHLWEARRTRDQISGSLRLLSRDGKEHFVHIRTNRIEDDAGRGSWCRMMFFDITAQHDAESALSASEAKFRMLADNIGDVFWFMTLNPPRITYVSPAFESILGIPVTDLYASHEVWEKSIHPDDLQAVRSAFKRWISGETDSFRVEYRVYDRNGEIHWLADHGSVLGWQDGVPDRVSGIARDITERKRMEKMLVDKAEETQTILEGTYEGILMADAETRRFTYGNGAMCRMLGATIEELLSMSFEDIHSAEALPDLRLKFEAVARGELSFLENVPLFRRNGSSILVDISAAPVVINGRRCIVGIFHDITERQRAEQQFRNLLEAAPDAMMIHGENGRIKIVNAQAEKLFGYTRAEMIGQTMEMLMPERFRRRHVQHRKNYTPTSQPRPMGADGMILRALHKDGREIPVEISLSNLESGPDSMVISSIRDITERERAAEELRQSQRFALSTLEAIPASLAVLNEHGTIISTNQSWNEFSQANGGLLHPTAIGANYLRVCDTAKGEGSDEAHRFAEGIREVMSDASQRFSMEYPCHSHEQQRWFVGYVTAFSGSGAPHVVIAHVDISERKRAEQVIRRLNAELELRVEERTRALNEANQELQKQMAARRLLEEEILHISEREQQRIGQDLHDDLGQQLAGIWCMSQVLEKSLAASKSPDKGDAARITSLLKDALALTRSLARGLHPVALLTGGLNAALGELAQRSKGVFRVDCRCECQSDIELENTTATHLYRIAQEAVTNAVKHGHAKQIEIQLSSNPHRIVLSVKDNGVGIAALDPASEGMGLRIMKYRADMIGGALALQNNAAGRGATVTCTISAPPASKPPAELSYGKKNKRQAARKTTKKSIHRR
jgi:PAS domain S-box-containing protein